MRFIDIDTLSNVSVHKASKQIHNLSDGGEVALSPKPHILSPSLVVGIDDECEPMLGC